MSTNKPSSSSLPAIKKGWMRKQGRSGVIKNWKKRFFVLTGGVINYYEEESKDHPYGDKLKVIAGMIVGMIYEWKDGID